jgi:hypothetical protein
MGDVQATPTATDSAFHLEAYEKRLSRTKKWKTPVSLIAS